jgi:beta-N-acetylhexosaminidase
MSDKIGALILDLEGLYLTSEEAELLNHPITGGVILFARNYENRSQITQLCRDIRKATKKPLIIMVDQEGGRVQRFRDEFFLLPSMGHFGAWFDKDPDIAIDLSQTCGWLMATELLSTGIDLSLAPVLDLNRGLNTVIGDRAFHSNPQTVYQLALAYAGGMKKAGMATTGKHFPGHGAVHADSHVSIPVDERDMAQIAAEDLLPFELIIREGVDAIMAAHILFPNIDNVQAGFSRFWLNNILREQLQFNGVIFTDDLNMQGADLSTNYADRVVRAREAGCDFALLCNNRQGVIETMDNLNPDDHQVTEQKWKMLQAKNPADNTQIQDDAVDSAKKYLQAHAVVQ